MVETTGLERLDVIKVDVEGYEWPVLQGAESVADPLYGIWHLVARFIIHPIYSFITIFLHPVKTSIITTISGYVSCPPYWGNETKELTQSKC